MQIIIHKSDFIEYKTMFPTTTTMFPTTTTTTLLTNVANNIDNHLQILDESGLEHIGNRVEELAVENIGHATLYIHLVVLN